MYKGYWGVVSGNTKCPNPTASTVKAEEAELHNKEITAWKDVDQRAAGAILLMLSAEELLQSDAGLPPRYSPPSLRLPLSPTLPD